MDSRDDHRLLVHVPGDPLASRYICFRCNGQVHVRKKRSRPDCQLPASFYGQVFKAKAARLPVHGPVAEFAANVRRPARDIPVCDPDAAKMDLANADPIRVDLRGQLPFWNALHSREGKSGT